ncbi:Scr1 family TA system antitoxin-like transcriptional regulator [Streptomyces sp. NPDC008139]|uniref:DUF5753 domain-containing protein n=1 Tax=Streptomyces sp. NPDC008139 TaxID=3364814 RepID=UPI0036E80E4A
MSTPQEALRMLRAPDQRHQGRAAEPDVGEVTAEHLAAIEAFAVTVRAWNPSLVPGPVQTTRYAAGAIRTTAPAIPPSEVQRRAHQRAARADQFLTRWSTGAVNEAVFVIGERALTQPLVHADAHRAQLRQLLAVSVLPNVHVHVVPEGRAVPGRLGQMSVYALEPTAHGGGNGVRVGYLETPVGGWYTTRTEDIARLHGAFAEIIGAALDLDGTRAFLTEVLIR